MSLIRADARAIPLRDGCVQCVVTSPPYFGLRDYGVSGQIGLEQTPDAYVAQLVAVFREVARVLADDGVLFLNLGDSYVSQGGLHDDRDDNQRGVGAKRVWRDGSGRADGVVDERGQRNRNGNTVVGMKPKDLIGIPWRVAFALQADGWYLRADIIWHKPNPMPESVTDRPTKAHEYVFLLTKSARYHWDAEAIAEDAINTRLPGRQIRDTRETHGTGGGNAGINNLLRRYHDGNPPTSRNVRSVWTIPTQPYAAAHFATFPEALAERCIRAGSRGPGKRCGCDMVIASPLGSGPVDDPTLTTGRAGFNRERRDEEGTRPVTRRQQRHWASELRRHPRRGEMEASVGVEAFAHYLRTDVSGARPPRPDVLREWLARGWLTEPTPCECPTHPGDLVFDPFGGSGTVVQVARRLNRRGVCTELNPAYLALASRRIAEQQVSLFEATA